jgi:RHS repeat-associated protein
MYAFNDWLGSKRVTTDPARTMTETCLSLPFGDALNCSGGIDPSEHHFTGKERDAETGFASGNDYFGTRYYGSSMGRFMSPDPTGGHLEDPQTLNRYSYVGNNPVSRTDPTGLDFYLQCQTASNTCASQTVGFDKSGNAQTALVQGVTNSDKSFTATQIGNDANGGLTDKTTGTGAYNASVGPSGVSFSQAGSDASSMGVFVNRDANPKSVDTNIQGTGSLSGFNFEYRSPGSSFTGANSGHVNVYEINLNPNSSVPQAQGNMHFGEHNPLTNPPFGLAAHCASDGAC